jgi:hypothetical protein
MSALARHTENAAPRLGAQGVPAVAGRARRAEAGTVTEMARSLLREAGSGLGTERRRGSARVGRIEPAQAQAPVSEAA